MRINCGREPADIERAFERLTRYFQPSPAPQAIHSPQTSEPDRTAPPGPHAPPPLPASAPRRRLRSLAIPYLRLLARIFLRRKKPLVIAITGSRGKTVTKRLLAELLAVRYRVRTNPRSYNTEIGLPLAVLNVEIAPQSVWSVLSALGRASWSALLSAAPVEILVVEFGVRQRGDMRRLLRTVRPDIAIVNTLTPSYSTDVELLSTLQAEIRTLCDTVGPRCRFIIDGDDPLLADMAAAVSAAAAGSVDPLLVRRADWSPNGDGLVLRSPTRRYPVGRELIGESEHSSVQAAVLLAERWTELSQADIDRFLAAQGERAEPR